MTWQSYAAEAAVRALDAASDRIGAGEKVVHRLADRWRSLNAEDKRALIEIGVAVASAIVVAVAAVRDKGPKKAVRKLARKAGGKVIRKVAGKAVRNVAKKK
ncbi:MAG TPA: hypothetical protein VGF28_07235 [Thermoanaerobaculia bacterium]|jgi:hypothetical protein